MKAWAARAEAGGARGGKSGGRRKERLYDENRSRDTSYRDRLNSINLVEEDKACFDVMKLFWNVKHVNRHEHL
jgi:hypothetical protein